MKIIKEILDWVIHIVTAVVIALTVVVFIIQPTYVRGYSMEPNLYDEDKILVNKLYGTLHAEINYGDIVIVDSRVERVRTFKDNIIDSIQYNLIAYYLMDKEPEEIFWVKRVIGKAGDEIEYLNGKLIRNDQPVDEPYIKETMEYFPETKIIVPEGCIFVMGDNRNESYDSRYVGCIPIDHIIGKYLLKLN